MARRLLQAKESDRTERIGLKGLQKPTCCRLGTAGSCGGQSHSVEGSVEFSTERLIVLVEGMYGVWRRDRGIDMTLAERLKLSESKSIQFRLEAFNVFNHAQFYGPASVDGNISNATFGQVVSAA